MLQIFCAEIDGAPAPDLVSFLKEYVVCDVAYQFVMIVHTSALCLRAGYKIKPLGELYDLSKQCCMENCKKDVTRFCDRKVQMMFPTYILQLILKIAPPILSSG